ncbi:uncharacterized protein LOC123665556 [Melitaea cinxia]|uniref:uncharacterized protein LOC123665556 n=1 Tax=Melitaea cinxia TaxID=113334 RepID=UPI001E27430E|nr:uncharacterized protein LOC123665556 [Melitaea cinxia]
MLTKAKVISETLLELFFRKMTNQYCRSEFGICNQTFLEVADVNQGSEISLRTAATKHSVGSGQGFVRCSCYKNCSTNRCQCKKALILCNSKCHQSKPCKNK